MHVSLTHNVSAAELVHIVGEAFQERAYKLKTDKSLGVVHTVEGMIDKCGDDVSSQCRRVPEVRSITNDMLQ